MGQQIPLRIGTKLVICPKNGSVMSYRIEEVIGYGGSCIVYRGKDVSAGRGSRTQIIKEFYPQSICSVRRQGDALIVSEEDRADFSERETQFSKGISTYSQYYEYDSSHTNPRPFLYGQANGTTYAVSDPVRGQVLSEVDRRDLSLHDISRILYSVCSAIGNFHDHGLLYLDCKPDNIYLCEVDQQRHVQLFDFDTVVSIHDVESGNISYSTYSPGWAPPEQERWGQNMNLPGKEADIYAIGAVFFYLLTDRKPARGYSGDSCSDLGKIKRGKFRWDKLDILKDCTATTRELVEKIALHTLRENPSERYQDVIRLQLDFQELCAITQGNRIKDQSIFSAITQGVSGLRDELGNIQRTSDETKDTVIEAEKKLGEAVSTISDHVTNIQEDLNRVHTTTDEIKKAHDETKGILAADKKRRFWQTAVLAVLLVVAIGIGAAALSDHHAETSAYTAAHLESGVNNHLLLELSNANHQYEMGIENWRRLDYTRAERDISLARDEISGQIAQSELETAKVNNSLGCLYLDMGRYREAYDYLNAAFVTFRDQLGEESLEARAARASIAQYDYYTGNLEGALAETQYILDFSDVEQEREIITAASHLRAMVYEAQGNWGQALALYEEVLKLYEDIAKDGVLSQRLSDYANDPGLTQSEKDNYTNVIRWIIFTYYNISQVNLQKGEPSAAAEAVQRGLELALSNVYIGRRNLTVSRLYMSLAASRSEMGDLKPALDDIDLAMRIQMNLFDFEGVYPGLVEVYDLYGRLLEEKGDTGQAVQYYQDAIDLALESFGENHPVTAAAYTAMGTYCYRHGEYEAGRELLAQAVEIRKNILADNHPDSAEIYYHLALTQEALGLRTEAVSNLMHALDICNHWEVAGQLREKLDNAIERLQSD